MKPPRERLRAPPRPAGTTLDAGASALASAAVARMHRGRRHLPSSPLGGHRVRLQLASSICGWPPTSATRCAPTTWPRAASASRACCCASRSSSTRSQIPNLGGMLGSARLGGGGAAGGGLAGLLGGGAPGAGGTPQPQPCRFSSGAWRRSTATCCSSWCPRTTEKTAPPRRRAPAQVDTKFDFDDENPELAKRCRRSASSAASTAASTRIITDEEEQHQPEQARRAGAVTAHGHPRPARPAPQRQELRVPLRARKTATT